MELFANVVNWMRIYHALIATRSHMHTVHESKPIGQLQWSVKCLMIFL